MFLKSWRHTKVLTFCNISVITEDIYLKVGVCLPYPKSNPLYQWKQFKMHFLFNFRIMPPFYLNFLFSISHPTAKHWNLHAVLMFYIRIVVATKLIHLSLLFIASTMVICESCWWLGNSIVHSTGQMNSRKALPP